MNTLPLEGRLAMVTGGCRNFGAEIAHALREAGARVIITSRHYETAADYMIATRKTIQQNIRL